MSREAVDGIEFDWFAVDGVGHVAHFATAGFGPVPVAALGRLCDFRELKECILELPVIGEATGHLPGRIDDWLEMARRGLFSYDWKHWSGPYIRAATPSVPIYVDELPEELLNTLRIVEWLGIRFKESTSLRPEEFLPCE